MKRRVQEKRGGKKLASEIRVDAAAEYITDEFLRTRFSLKCLGLSHHRERTRK